MGEPVQFNIRMHGPYTLTASAMIGDRMWMVEFGPAQCCALTAEDKAITDRMLEALNLGLREMCKAGLFKEDASHG